MSRIVALMPYMNVRQLLKYIYILIFAEGGSLVCQYAQFIIMQRVEKNSRTDLKKKILREVMDTYFWIQRRRGDFNSARINQILYTDVNDVTEILFLFVDMCVGCCSVLVTGILLFDLDFCLTLVLTIIFMLSSILVSIYSKRLKKINVELREETDKHFKLARDIIKNVKYICLSNSTEFHYSKYTQNLDEVKCFTLYRDKKAWILGFISTIFENGWIVFLLCYSIVRINSNCFEVATFMLFFSYSRIYGAGITGLFRQYANLQQLSISAERVIELLTMYQQSEEGKNEFPEEVKNITIEDLYFSYEKKNVISALSMEIRSKAILVVGENGRGKTTLLNLLAGGLLPNKGHICYNDIPIESISLKSLQNSIAYAVQGDVIFDMSIRENLLCFSGHELITDERMLEICQKVGIAEDILSLKEGFDTQISEIRDFSFGQKKKMLLVRTCLKPSKVMFFDEPLEGLDTESQKRVTSFLQSMARSKYIFISTHKPEQFEFCDEIIFL